MVTLPTTYNHNYSGMLTIQECQSITEQINKKWHYKEENMERFKRGKNVIENIV